MMEVAVLKVIPGQFTQILYSRVESVKKLLALNMSEKNISQNFLLSMQFLFTCCLFILFSLFYIFTMSKS